MYVCEVCDNQFTPKHPRPSRHPRFCSITCFNSTKRKEAEPNFWTYVKKTEECWIWQGSKSKHGYGYFSINGKTHKAHRVAYELAHGISLGSLIVCHKCDNPSCVSPDHLFTGTHKDNAHDAFGKGRRNAHFAPSSHPGTENGRAKLTDDNVREIRRLAKSGMSVKEIMTSYPVKQVQVNKIIRRVSWKHVGEC